MSLVLNVEILGEFKNLTAATKGAQSQLSSLNSKASKISAGMNKAFAAIGVGFSLRVITQQLEQAAKAAVEDSKSMNLLALAMENTAGATKQQVAEAEKSINKMQFQAGVADDQLRPAFQKLFIATKDVTQSNRLLQIALDASAATGKDLDTISQAMARSLAGSDTALTRLIPSLKGAKDPMAELERLFKGAAAEAANTDPYQRMQVIFGEMQEQIGYALLPVLNEFSTWLGTPEGQEKLQEIVDFVVLILTEFTALVGYILENKDWLLPVITAIGLATAAWKIYTIGIGLSMAAEKIFTASSIANAVSVQAAWNLANLARLGALGLAVGAVLAVPGSAQQEPPNVPGNPNGFPNSPSFGNAPSRPVDRLDPRNFGNVNININATQSAQQIADVVARATRSSGSRILPLGSNRLL